MHGWGGDKSSLKAIADSLKGEFRVTLVDFYGFGDTPHPARPLKLEDFALSIVELIQFYKMSGVILVGHSFGGRVALLLSARWGYLIDKLILIDGAGLRPRRKPSYYIKKTIYKIKKRLHFDVSVYGSADYKALTGEKKRTFVNVVNFHLDRYLKYVTLPVLLIWGRKDKETPLYMANKLHKRLSDSKLYVLNNAGHYSYLDSKAECLAVIKGFLGGEDG